MRKLLLLLLISLVSLGNFALAQHNLDETNNTYTQDFNSLTAGGTWTDNSTLTAWYSNRTSYIVNAGSLNTGALYSYGTVAAPDRALGSLGSGSTGTIYYGVRLRNNGSSAITSITVSYTGEQWRSGSSTVNTLAFSYAVSGSPLTSITAGSHTNFSSLNFVSPNLTSAAAIDGNLSANKTIFTNVTITVSIPVGSEIMLRWADPDDASSDQGISVDDLTVVANYPCTPPTATIGGGTTICSGSGTNITFSGTPGATVTYNDGTSNQTVVLDIAGNATVPTGTLTTGVTYSLVSANIGSCSQTLTGSAVVTVDPLPTSTISAPASVCSGSSANVIFSGTPGATITYDIDGSNTTTVTLDANGDATVPTAALTVPVTYNLISASLGSCSQSLTGSSAVIGVDPLPAATIAGGTTICENGSALITFTGTPGATVYYNIDGGSAQSLVLDLLGEGTLPTGVLTTTTTYFLDSVSDGTCTAALADNEVVNVTPLPVVSITGGTTICTGSGTNITFTGTPNAVVTYNVNGSANTTINLDINGDAILSTGTLTDTATYYLLDVTANGCSQTYTDSVVVNVDPVPTATINGANNVCIGNTSTVFFNGTPNATVTYTIDGGSPLTVLLDATGNASVTTATLSAATTYTLVDATLNSCNSSLTGNLVINVSPAPTATISGTTSVSPGNNVNIQFTGTPNAVVSYTVNNGPIQTVTLSNAGTATVNTGTLYFDVTYTLVDVTLGCTQPVTGSATVTMTVGYGPIYTYTNATNGNYDFVAVNATGTNLSLLNGAVVSGTPCAAGYTTEEYHLTNTYNPQTNAGVGATVLPTVGYRLIITGFSVGLRRDANGPQYARLAYSVDGGANWISSGVDGMPNNSTCDDVTVLNFPTAPFQVISTTLGLRFAVFGFDAAGPTGQLQILNFTVNGAVVQDPLPVTLTSFDAACRNNNIAFSWKVDKERNLANYAIQYSADGRQFSNVVVEAATGNKNYSTLVYNASEGLYRLAMNEFTGVSEYSDVVNVNCNGGALTIPTTINVQNNSLSIRSGSEFKLAEPMSIEIYNMSGQMISSKKNVDCRPLMKMEMTLAQGIYVIRLVQGDVVSVHKLFRD
jgi:hypothetical protein